MVATYISNIKRSNFFVFAYINNRFIKADIFFLLVNTHLYSYQILFLHPQTARTVKENLFSLRNKKQLSFKFDKFINSAFEKKI